MTSLNLDATADEAIRLLGRGESPGDTLARDAGIDLASATLMLATPNWSRSPQLASLCARLLRARFRQSLEPGDLIKALELLGTELAAEPGDKERSVLLSEYSLTMMMSAEYASSQAVLAQGMAQRAHGYAELALRFSGESEPIRAAALHALGMALKPVEHDAALAALREAGSDVGTDPVRRFDYARVLVDDPAEWSRAGALFRELSTELLSTRPSLAFEIARFHAIIAEQQHSMLESAEAYGRAISARGNARDVEASDARQLRWLASTYSSPAEAAATWVGAGDIDKAVEVLESAAALELVEGLGDRPSGSGLIRPDERIVYFAVSTLGSFAFTVDPDRQGIAVHKLPLGVDQLKDRAYRYLDAYQVWLNNPDSPGARIQWMKTLEDSLSWLTDNVLGPVIADLPPSVALMTVIPDQILSVLPLHAAAAASTPAGGHSIAIRYALSARTLARERAGDWPDDCLVVAEPSVSGARRLPFAEIEGKFVRGMFVSGTLLVGAEANLEAVDANLPNRGLIHFASHGHAQPDIPQLSSIALSGGEELTIARLRSRHLQAVRLVVLSACETGVQDVRYGQERVGLPLAFLRAGAAGVIASLWAVSDASTSLLMARFYVGWRETNDPIVSLTEAQTWLRTTTRSGFVDWLNEPAQKNLGGLDRALRGADGLRPFDHPFYWAGFAYFGV